MKKLYAIRDKETGGWGYEVNQQYDIHPRIGDIITLPENADPVCLLRKYLKELPEKNLELVTLRIEPTEPCEFCKNPKNLLIIFICEENYDENVWIGQELEPNLCPVCGRRLKDD